MLFAVLTVAVSLLFVVAAAQTQKAGYLSFTTLTHASQLAPPHTNASTGYDWSPAWAAHTKSFFCVRLITFYATISHLVDAVPFQTSNSDPYLDYQAFLLFQLWCPCFQKTRRDRSTVSDFDVSRIFRTFLRSPLLWVCTVLLYLDKTWGSPSGMYL